MLVPVPKHLSFTRLKISASLLDISEIYLSQYITFSLTQLISPSTRSVSIEIQSSFLLSPSESLSFLDPWSSMIWTILSIEREWNSFVFRRMNLSLPDPYVDNYLDNPGDQTWVEFTFLFSNECIFSRSIVEIIRKAPSMESEWNSLLSPWITSLPCPDPRSRMARTIPSIESNWIHFCLHLINLFLFQINRRQWSAYSRRSKVSEIHYLVSSRKPLSFLDPWSTMFCTFWLMERRMGWPLLSTKLSLHSPTTEVPSTANIRQSSDMLRTCLTSWRVARNRGGPHLRKLYGNFDVIVCSFSFFGVLSCSKHEIQ